jgi:hypothetical protein
MKSVFQTMRGEKGNCFAACIASILEMPIEAMPVYLGLPDQSRWLAVWREFLYPLGFGIAWFPHNPGSACIPPLGYAIAAMHAPLEGDPGNTHTVVCLDGRIIHDPLTGEQTLLQQFDHWYVITILNPAKEIHEN